MRLFGLLFILNCLGATDPSFHQKVENYLLISKSRLGENPQVWQDTKNGYLRFQAIITIDSLFEKIDNVELMDLMNDEDILEIEFLRKEILKGEEIDTQFNQKADVKKRINYFSSSS